MKHGPDAIRAWTAALMRSGGAVTAAVSWTQDGGWKACLAVDSGETLMLSSKQMRKLADRYVKGGGRKDPAISGMIDHMYEVAAEAKRKNARREVPPDAVEWMVPGGTA